MTYGYIITFICHDMTVECRPHMTWGIAQISVRRTNTIWLDLGFRNQIVFLIDSANPKTPDLSPEQKKGNRTYICCTDEPVSKMKPGFFKNGVDSLRFSYNDCVGE